MVAHQNQRVDAPARPGARFTQGRQESLAIRVIAKDRLPPIATIKHMINRSFKFDTGFSSHAPTLCRFRSLVQEKERHSQTDPLLTPSIQKKIVIDEHGEPQEVIIPWAQYCELSEALGLDLDAAAQAELREAIDDSRARRCEAFTPLDEL